eukprot:5361048-Pyramimonas_sp.AAC.1
MQRLRGFSPRQLWGTKQRLSCIDWVFIVFLFICSCLLINDYLEPYLNNVEILSDLKDTRQEIPAPKNSFAPPAPPRENVLLLDDEDQEALAARFGGNNKEQDVPAIRTNGSPSQGTASGFDLSPEEPQEILEIERDAKDQESLKLGKDTKKRNVSVLHTNWTLARGVVSGLDLLPEEPQEILEIERDGTGVLCLAGHVNAKAKSSSVYLQQCAYALTRFKDAFSLAGGKYLDFKLALVTDRQRFTYQVQIDKSFKDFAENILTHP